MRYVLLQSPLEGEYDAPTDWIIDRQERRYMEVMDRKDDLISNKQLLVMLNSGQHSGEGFIWNSWDEDGKFLTSEQEERWIESLEETFEETTARIFDLPGVATKENKTNE